MKNLGKNLLKKLQRNEEEESKIFLILAIFVVLTVFVYAETINVGIGSIPVSTQITNVSQNTTIYADGPNTTISIPIIYYTSGLLNITIRKPLGWTNGIGWIVNEAGEIIYPQESQNTLTWQANLSEGSATLNFNLTPPTTNITGFIDNGVYFQKNFSISAANHFLNVSGNVTVNTSYPYYALFWYNGSEFVNRTVEYNFSITSQVARFHGFTTSTQDFMVFGSRCIESWSCSDWSICTLGTQTRSCVDTADCGNDTLKPSESRSCVVEEVESSDGSVSRTNTDFSEGKEVVIDKLEGEDFEYFTEPNKLRVRLFEGDSIQTSFKVISNKSIQFVVEISDENNIVSTQQTQFTDSETIYLDIDTKDLDIGVYTALIEISGDIKYTIPITIIIEERIKDYEFRSYIDDTDTIVLPGDTVTSFYYIRQVTFPLPAEFIFEFEILNSKGQSIYYEKSNSQISNEFISAKNFEISDKIKPDIYFIHIKSTHNSVTKESVDSFRVAKVAQKDYVSGFAMIGIILLFITLFYFISHKSIPTKHKKRH